MWPRLPCAPAPCRSLLAPRDGGTTTHPAWKALRTPPVEKPDILPHVPPTTFYVVFPSQPALLTRQFILDQTSSHHRPPRPTFLRPHAHTQTREPVLVDRRRPSLVTNPPQTTRPDNLEPPCDDASAVIAIRSLGTPPGTPVASLEPPDCKTRRTLQTRLSPGEPHVFHDLRNHHISIGIHHSLFEGGFCDLLGGKSSLSSVKRVPPARTAPASRPHICLSRWRGIPPAISQRQTCWRGPPHTRPMSSL